MSAAGSKLPNLMLFTRLPVPGRTKTRLMPSFPPEWCAALHRAMLADITAAIRRLLADGGLLNACLHVFFTPDGDEAALSDLRRACGPAVYVAQEGASLCERMRNAMNKSFGLGFAPCLLMGSDVPSVTEGDILAAYSLLEHSDAVLAPTYDGGYWLVGLNEPRDEIFEESGGFEAALALCKRAMIRVGVGPRLRDIDTPEDVHQMVLGAGMPNTRRIVTGK
ncbi:MAG: TIGR04282 family arsenosugar biosynthesis glycosyltransferase [Synergistaceae bacterium]|jgi:rSAM/selenodomain-associated transferase 1|nr:TIGR04282 family arsenosugar biosynthesis glycosyltransferase [Synergistaceae bacterium]